jgi:hypothetical protein
VNDSLFSRNNIKTVFNETIFSRSGGVSIENKMKLYLAGEHTVKNGTTASWDGLKILESYVYAKDNKQFNQLIKGSVDLLLDSGAFTYMTGNGGKVN